MASLASEAVRLGLVRYVVHIGIQCWGFSLFVLTCLYEVLRNKSIDEREFVLRLLACSVGGLLWGIAMWVYEKRRS